MGARNVCLEISIQVDHSVLGQIHLTGLEQTGAWKNHTALTIAFLKITDGSSYQSYPS